ncbi:MAG: hypothetical protein ABSG05_02665 [Candidatus Pacearchaeota archaeon]|jgi:hypothetical protein
MKTTIRYAIIDALGASLYIVLVASFIYFLGRSFPGSNSTILIPIAMLMLFVFSAALTGILVLGRPIAFYLDGKKREAWLTLFYTLGFILVITIIVFLILFAVIP